MKALRRLSGVPSTVDSGLSRPLQSSSVKTKVNSAQEVQKQSSAHNPVDESSVRAKPELILYGRSSCPYCARVDRAIKEMGIEDNITRRHTGFGTEWRADLRERTGSTQVPCLFIDGEPMFESLDIIAWLKANVA